MKIKVNEKEINYRLERKKRKTISIKITDDAEVVVSVPLSLSSEKIADIVRDKAEWILSKLELMEVSKKDYIEDLKFLGENYKLIANNTQNKSIKVVFNRSEFQVYVPSELENKDKYIKEALTKWYKIQASSIYKERTEHYSKLLNVHPNRITIKEQKTRWGSCSSKGNLNFNWRVTMAPIEIVDYLVVHELCHLIHMNHSKDFWNLVESVLPGYKKCRDWLKVNGSSLKI
jgi:predicted metal-dependent hydrolase